MRATILRSYQVANITATVITSVSDEIARTRADRRLIDVEMRRGKQSHAYLSTSQSTISIEPRIITASARYWPTVISRSADRLQNEGDRIFRR